MFDNLIKNHDEGVIDCIGCEEQFGPCSCGGIVHCEYQDAFQRAVVLDIKTRNRRVYPLTHSPIVLECDRCDDYEIE